MCWAVLGTAFCGRGQNKLVLKYSNKLPEQVSQSHALPKQTTGLALIDYVGLCSRPHVLPFGRPIKPMQWLSPSNTA